MNDMNFGRPPAWMRDAGCAGESVELFFSLEDEPKGARQERERKAKALCGSCPVRPECLAYAIDQPERYGFWGGHSPKERDAVRRRQARRARAA